VLVCDATRDDEDLKVSIAEASFNSVVAILVLFFKSVICLASRPCLPLMEAGGSSSPSLSSLRIADASP